MESDVDGEPRRLDIVVPEQPPVMTPGLAAALLRLILRRVEADRGAGERTDIAIRGDGRGETGRKAA
jgi:hypothetical protein